MSNEMFRIIGLTGQSGAGKSTVSEVLTECGLSVLDADKLAHKTLETEECKENLRKVFGNDIFDADGEVIRKALAKAAFSCKENTLLLDKATHPVIAKLAKAEFEKFKESGKNIVIFDAPTLFESGLDSDCSAIVSVIAPENVRLQRIMERDNLTEEEAKLRLNAQGDDDFYTHRSQYVIVNDGTLSELKSKAVDLYKELCG